MKRLLFMIAATLFAQEQIPSGTTVIDSMTAIMSPENSKGLIKQTNHYADGKTRTFDMEMYSGDKGDKMLMRYFKPISVKGQTFLILNAGDDIWTYFPRTRRVRKLASHAKKQKVQGSDFSFADFSSENTWDEDYFVTNTGITKKAGVFCWVLKAEAREGADVDYSSVMLYVRQDNYYPVQIDYFHDDGDLEKTLTLTNIRKVDDYPTAMVIIMANYLTGTKTVMETLEMSYGWQPPKNFFSERSLKK